MNKLWIGNTKPNKIWIGNTEVKKLWIGNTLIYDIENAEIPTDPEDDDNPGGGTVTPPNPDGGDNTGGNDSSVLKITSIYIEPIPASGGSVSSGTAYYTLDGVSKQKTVTFDAISGENLGTTESATKVKETITITVSDGGASDSKTVDVYQAGNTYTDEVLEYGNVTVSHNGNISATTTSVDISATQTNKVKRTYSSGSTEETTSTIFPTNGVFSNADGVVITGGGLGYHCYTISVTVNKTTSTRDGGITLTFGSDSKNIGVHQAAGEAEKTAKQCLSVSTSQISGAPSGVVTITITNTSNRNIIFSYWIGSNSSDVKLHEGTSISGNGTWTQGGYWGGIEDASFA